MNQSLVDLSYQREVGGCTSAVRMGVSSLLCMFFGLIILMIGVSFVMAMEGPLPDDPLERAIALMRINPLIDGHNDLPLLYRNKVQLAVSKLDISVPQPSQQTDIPRLREGHVGGQFWSVYIGCDYQFKDAVRATMEQIDVVRRLADTYPQTLRIATSTSEIVSAFEEGRIASLMGIEGGHQIDSSMGALRMFYEQGVRYITLNHNCNTPWSESCCAGATNFTGITQFGVDMVLEMNRIGMLVDLSHTSQDTMRQTLDVVKAPLIFSHSSCYALRPVPRNVPDDVLERLPANGGLIMITFVPSFLTNGTATLSDVADHIDHAVRVAGIDHVGIGGDYDGVDSLPIGLEDVSRYPHLFAELIRRGYSDDSIVKILGANLLRVLRAAEIVRDQLSGHMPSEAIIFPKNSCRTPF